MDESLLFSVDKSQNHIVAGKKRKPQKITYNVTPLYKIQKHVKFNEQVSER